MKKLKVEIFFNENQQENGFVSRLKSRLKSMAVDLYHDMGDDIELEEESYVIHYSNLGRLLHSIERITSFREFLVLSLRNEFEEILDVDDEEGFQDFISNI